MQSVGAVNVPTPNKQVRLLSTARPTYLPTDILNILYYNIEKELEFVLSTSCKIQIIKCFLRFIF